ncbi:MAG TPA: hypothetical protein VFM39_06905 [bacterium]|nr:hypothetical protein [bacterium]
MWTLRALVIVVTAVSVAGCVFLAPRPEYRPGVGVERTVTLQVEGTPGLAFEGSYGTPQSTTATRGTVPAQYRVKTAVAVAANFTKSAADGELVVRIIVDGQELQQRSTTAPFGSVVVLQRFAP